MGEKQVPALAMEEAAKISDMSCVEEPQICIFKTQDLLSDAQRLMRDIEQLLDLCPSSQRQCRMKIPRECEYSIEEDGESMVIEDFRFESAANREDLMMLGTRATHD